MDVPVSYTPQMFGAPLGAQIMQATVYPTLSQGSGNVHDESVTREEVSFVVHTDAEHFGSHSGIITVTTNILWFCVTETAVEGGESSSTPKVPAVLLKAA